MVELITKPQYYSLILRSWILFSTMKNWLMTEQKLQYNYSATSNSNRQIKTYNDTYDELTEIPVDFNWVLQISKSFIFFRFSCLWLFLCNFFFVKFMLDITFVTSISINWHFPVLVWWPTAALSTWGLPGKTPDVSFCYLSFSKS